MRYTNFFLIFLSCSIFISLNTFAQTLTATQGTGGLSAQQFLIDNFLEGECVQISNVSYSGSNQAIGYFTYGTFEGIILSTGRITDAVGDPGDGFLGTGAANTQLGQPGDAQLTNLVNNDTHDAAIIEFDFVPTANTVTFGYRFASEEYPDYVGSQFNDVFAFAISGPGIVGVQNMAQLPGAAGIVSINNVNCCSNATYYNGEGGGGNCNNDCGNGLPGQEYNGMTDLLVATATVQACQTYHLKIAIADVGDEILDSAVFLQAQSFDAGGGSIAQAVGSTGSGTASTYEDCTQGYFVVKRAQGADNTSPMVVTFNVGGTATPNIDYQGTMPTSVTIPANQDSIIIPVNALADALAEGTETITLQVTSGGCACAAGNPPIVMNIIDNPPITVSIAPQNICPGQLATLTASASGGLPFPSYNYVWSPGGATTASITGAPASTTTYTVTVSDICGNTASASTTVTVSLPTATAANSGLACQSGTINLSSSGGTSYAWSGANSFSSAQQNPTITLPNNIPAGNYTYTVTVTSASGCTATATTTVVVTAVTATANNNGPVCNTGGNVTLNASGGTVYAWNDGGPPTIATTASTTISVPAGTPSGSYPYYVTVTNANGCSSTTQTTVTVNSAITPTFTAIPPFCSGDAAPLLPATSNNGITGTWNPAAVSNTTAATYTFTPNTGQCATTAILTTTITPPTTPTFAAIPPFCSGDVAPLLPATSNNGITGTWNPTTVSNTTAATYTFTPNIGQCATTATLTTTITPPTTPTFTAIPPFCSGDAAPLLPATSNNGITGTWNPAAVSNTAAATYTFTPNAGQCATTAILTTTITPPTTPTFTAIPPFCSGDAAPLLPATANNGITGAWNPAAVSNTTAATYTFTPNIGQCATTATLTTTINPPTTPTFTAIPPFCSGDAAPLLPATSNNGITGTWNPAAVSNTAAATYTFTPNAGQCATTAILTTTITPPTTPTFTAIPPFCSGDAAPLLPATANNGITGAWNPAAVSNTTAATYTFTPNIGQCATTATLTTTINPPTTPTFTAIPPFCSGDVAPLLPATANNGIAGTWNPATVSNTAAATYTFTPNAGQCATTATLTTTITPPTTPTFTAIPPFCSGDVAPLLPATANNGITGTWNPATVSNTAAATYTFTPNAGQCATTATLTTTITPPTTPTFTAIPPFCSGDVAPLLPATANNGITGTWNPAAVSNTAAATYTFTPNAGQCATTATLTSAITLLPTITLNTTCGATPFNGSGSITATASVVGGGILEYSIDGVSFQASNVFNNLSNGAYTITVRVVGASCTETATTSVNCACTPPTLTVTDPAPICQNANNNATINLSTTITSNTGTTPTYYTLLALANAGGAGDVANPAAVGSGTYYIRSNNPTDASCYVTQAVTVVINPLPPAAINPVTAVCQDQAITLTATGGTTYNWAGTGIGNTSANPQNISNLTPNTNTYTVTVTDSNNCSATATVNATINPIPTTTNTTTPNTACIAPFNGGINLSVTPAASYQFNWSNNATSEDLTGINDDTYTVTITNPTTACSTTTTVTVADNSAAPNTTNTTTPNTACATPFNGGATLTTSGFAASPTPTYAWSNSATTQNLSNVAAGTYTVTITQGSCSTTANVTVVDNIVLSASASPTPNTACATPFNGGATLTTSGFAASPTPTYAWSNSATTQNLSNVAAGTYTVTVTQGSCSTTANVTVVDNIALSASASPTPNTACATPFNGGATLSTSGFAASPTPTYAWSNSATTQNLSNVAAGTYTVTVTQGSCSTTANVTVVDSPVLPTITLNTTCGATPFNGSGSITATASVVGGGTLEYSIDGVNFQASNVFNNLSNGAYTITVRVVGASCTETATTSVNCACTPPTLTVTDPAPICQNANNNATINLSTTITSNTGTTPTYYTLLALANAGGAGDVANPAAVGSGTYYIRSNNPTDASCYVTQAVTVVINPLPPAAINPVAAVCQDQSITLTATGGTTYNWAGTGIGNTSANPQNISNLTPNTNTYTVTVTDSNNCSATATVNATINPIPTTTNTTTPNTACIAPFNGGINLSVTPAASYQFNWSNNATSEDLTAIEDGIYTVTITNPTTACSTTTTVTVADNSAAPNTTNTTTPNTACTSPFNGGINLSVTPAASYQFNWSNAATTEDLTAIEDGIYTVTITNPTTACSTITTVTVADNSAAPTTTNTTTPNTACTSPFNGGINLSVTPAASYQFNWSNAATTEDLTAIEDGTYTVTVTNPTTACSTTTTVTVADNTVLPTASISGTTSICSGNNANITFTGTPNATVVYTLNGNTQTLILSTTGTSIINTGIITNTRTYALVSITSEAPLSCTQTLTGSAIVTLNNLPIVTLNTDCGANPFNGGGSIIVDATVVGGGTLEYSIDGTNFQAANTFANLTNGAYTITVRVVGSDCVATASVNVSCACTAPNLTIVPPSAICQNLSGNATLNLTTSITTNTGTSPTYYTSLALANAGGLGDVANPTAVGSGTYYIRSNNPTDATCFTVQPVTVTINALPTTSNVVTPNTACSAPFDGAIDLTVTPAASYQFNWSNTSTNEDLVGIDDATYTVTVTNTNTNCSTTTSIVVGDASAAPTTSNLVTPNTACSAPFDGGIDLTVTPAASYQFNWSNTSTNEDLTAIEDGIYTVTVTNTATNCSTTTSIVVADNSAAPTTSNLVTPNTACSAPFDGGIDLTVTPAASYQFNWSNTSTNEDLVGIDDATYTVTVTNTNTNCSTTASIVVGDASAAPTTSNLVTPNTACSAPFDGGIDLTVLPAASYQFNWSNSSTNEDLVGIDATTYTVTVTNTATNCSTTASIVVGDASAAPTTSNLVTPNTACSAPFDGGIDLTVTPAASYQFNWSNASINEDLVGIDAATYTVTVTNTNTNCSTTTSIVVADNSAAPTPAINGTTTYCLGETATPLTASGGNSYQWSISDLTNQITPATTTAATTTYTVTVTNSGNCTATTSVTVTVNALPTLSLAVDCGANPINGSGVITATASISGGNGTLEYAIDGVNFQANNTFSSLINGAYTVTVSVIETGCTTTETINVSCACTAPTLTVADPAPICQNANNNATLDLTTSVTSNTGTTPTYYTTLALANAGGAGNVATPAAVTAGTYYVRSNNTADPTCFTVEPITVTINALPTPNINAVEPICEGESVTLTATGGTAYVWSSGGGNAANATYNSLNATTTYTVTATGANTCSATATVTVTVQNCGCVTPAAPTAINPNQAICAGETLPTFTANPAPNTAINWYDAPNGGNLIGTGNTFTPTVAGTYYAEAINIPADACQSPRIAFTLTINPLPIALFILDEVICTNQTATITFNGTPTTNATYAWAIEDNPLQTGSTATATWATTGQKDVTLTVTTDAGCTAQTTQSIGVSDVTASTIADQSIILGSSIALPVTAQSGLQGALTYTWTPTDGSLSCNNCINPAASPTQTTTYTILVADEFGCQATDNVTVAVMQENTLIIPNAFSPNNDGTNDVFHINGANIAEFTMAIFDRWGQKVYETKATNLNEGWNGLYPDGKTAELGVYVYQLTVSFSDGKTEFAKGNISLLW